LKEIERDEILEVMREAKQPLSLYELADQLVIEPGDLEPVLIEMEMKGYVILTRKAKYGLPEHMNLRAGRIQRHQKGFAFLITDNPDEDDIYVSGEDLNNALNNDRVIIRLYKQIIPGKRAEGKVLRILERANNKVVGTYEEGNGFGFVIPDDTRLGTDLFISKKNARGAREGMKVVAEILEWPEKRRNPEAVVIEILGKKGEPGIDIISIIRKHDLPEDFPEEVKSHVAKQDYKISSKELERRKDLRNLKMVTIDGEDAKDLDDAVSLKINEKGHYVLGVHIADVGHYVKEDSVLDKEAVKRGTSVYLVDRVIPMLPRELSNGICSLNANEDRLSMSCIMEITSEGKIVDYEIAESVINVNKRMTYTNVNRVITDEDPEAIEEFKEFADTFREMNKLRQILFDKRMKRGAIDFDFPESKVIVDETGKPVEIKRRDRGQAESLIEEFMLAANETVAAHYHALGIPFVYRVHEEPDSEKLADLKSFIAIFGYYLKGAQNKVFPKSYQEVIEQVKGKKEERIVSTMMLRSMRHARYATEPLGHFGLSAQFYSHFTSPIRRYPDLAIHRVIKEMVVNENKLSSKRIKTLKDKLADYAERSSIRELVAEEAERETTDLKKVEYMSQFVGDDFEGTVSGVTPFGIFVELDNLIEGLVHISTMDKDYYIFNEKMLALMGERTKQRFTIGDVVKVKIVRTNIETRQIDMELVD
jgi:ribonuclease R